MEGCNQQLFALTKNPKYVKMRLPKPGRPSKIEQYCKRRKDRMKPKRQEDSSCVFAYRFCRGTCHRRDTAGKEKGTEVASAQIRKKFCKSRWDDTAGKSSRERQAPAPVCRSQSAAPVIRGIAHPSIRHRADHRTPAEPSAAEFSGMVSATALSEQGIFAPCGSVLTCTSKERQTHRQAAKSTQYQGFPPAAV